MWGWMGVALGYLLGSIPWGVLVARWIGDADPRRVGSGRTGGTNVLRAAGWEAALITGLGDGLKAALAVWVTGWLGGSGLAKAMAGAAAVMGHDHSLFLGFNGGAGTASSMGGVFALWPWSLPILLPIGAAVIFVTRRASLGSIAVALILPAVAMIRAGLGVGPWEHVCYGLLTSALTLWALRPNIGRLARGEERQVDLKAGQVS